ncbi:polyketide synthase [Diaporthe helianthi]|uniref:Polyketide synthase n=1 Tax=Diaporthe helianthi TaxID=158607 RepID=A0A2P5I399_DIAHE|nr:polyketide synthase [Diaporthe helianthi]
MDAAPTSVWISSVFEGRVMKPEDLKAEYWADNLLSPVLFSFAVEQALVKHTPLEVGVEVGAHPALKNPTIQTIENCAGSPIPYTGCMERNKDDTESFSSCLGYLWSRFGSPAIDIDKLYSKLALQKSSSDLVKELPHYSWDHSRKYRKESRTLRSWLGGERPHLLLGKKLVHSSPSSVQWQNFVRQRDIDWLDGHSLQGQTVFPGAGYVVMAMEAAIKLSGDQEVGLLEVLDLSINKAVTFEDENSLVELNTTLSIDDSQSTDEFAVYKFTINSCLARESGLSSSAAGLVAVTYGPGALETLPEPQVEPPHLNNVSIDRFYNMLDEVGYGYHKQFRGVSSLRRGDSKACGTINFHRQQDGPRNLVMHPATLDVAFQSFIGAYTAPGDRRLRSLLVPTGIERIALNPWVSDKIHALSSTVNFTSTSAASVGNTVEGDIEVYDPETGATMLQVEGLSFRPFSPPSAAEDHEMFSKWDWAPLHPDPLLDNHKYHATEQDIEDVKVIERITYWYIKHFLSGVTTEDREHGSFTFKKQIHWCEHMLSEAKAGRNAWYQPDWDQDTRADVEDMIQKNVSHPFVRLIQRVGEGAVETLRESKNAFDLMDHDGLLTEFYGGTVSYGHSYNYYQTMLEQINHRYQNLDVLEIGAGTGGASRYFLNNDKLSFNSYTFTDISSAFFEQAAKEFERHADKMDFRPLDVRRDPTEQEFKAHSYDLIIASNVLHATPSLEETLKNVHKLLKPGGRLIVIEVAHREHTRIGFIFGLFVDWWAGHDEGRVLEPFISYDQWDVVLKKAGFSGIDGRTLDPDSRISPNGVFHTHAVDELVQRLDAPLAAPVRDSYPPLVVIGGSSPKTAGLVESLSGVFPARKMDRVATIKGVIDFDYQPGSTFIVLSDLDEHTFASDGFDDEQLDALQTLFNAAHNILWVTEDAWVQKPQQAMMIGFLRTLRMEYPDINIKVADFDKADSMRPEFLMETVFRLEDGAGWQDNGILWTQEPELFVKGSNVIVPRLKPDTAKNNRLNAVRRPILVNSDPKQDILSFEYDDNEPYFKHLDERFVPSVADECLAKVKTHYSLAKSVRIGQLGYLHLIQGEVVGAGAGSNETVVALSETNASFVQVPSNRLVTVGEPGEVKGADALAAISADLIAHTLVSDLSPGSTLLVFNPPALYVDPLVRRAVESSISLAFVSTKVSPETEGINWIRVHEKEPQRSLRRKIPRDTAVFYDLTEGKNPAGLNKRLARCLPVGCSVRHVDNLYQNVAKSVSTEAPSKMRDVLASAVGRTSKMAPANINNLPVLRCSDVAALKGDAAGTNAIIDWTSEQIIPSRVRSMEAGQTFVDNKTYLLVGLAGDLGRSIARFMVEHGARHIVLTSRSPKIDQRWIDEVTRLGGNIMVLAMDVSKEESVDAGLAQVRASSMPPIGGVAFGPLVLQDVMFKNMDLSMLEMVLAPKVTGARLLDERLSDPANPLDFFVMFSSFVMVSGNPGQAAYSAANAYTHALAQQRRARGLAGSTIDIGAVFGVGFIARAGREHEYDVVKFIFDEVNEWELHALFAEAVVAGRNKAIQDVEVITGMPYMDPINRDRIPYFDDPRFAYFKLSDRKARGDDAGGAIGSVKDRLLRADTMDAVRSIIIDGLSGRIRGALQLTAADELNLATPLIDQGVDSLSAVTVSSWFNKNLSIDIPLLKILGGASVNDLVDEAVSRLTPETIPLAHSDGSGSPDGLAQPGSTAQVVSDTTTPDTESSIQFDGAATPPSSVDDEEEAVEREAPLSITQEYAWKQQQLGLDAKTFNSTIGMYMKGPLNLDQLAWAFNRALQRNDAFRTAFIPSPDGSGSEKPIQFVMKTPYAKFEAVRVADKAAAEQGFKDLEGYQYDLAKGDTLKLVDFHWSPTDHLLVIAYHRLVGDGWTTEHLFVEAGQLYSGARLQPAPTYADFALRQRQQLASGEFTKDLDYWAQLFSTPPARLPLINVPGAKAGITKTSWAEHAASARLNPMIAVRIKDRSRKHKVTPMHYYLASMHVVLARLTGGSTDVAIGVADAMRPTLLDQATMGYFFNLLPLRFSYAPDMIFNEALAAAKEQMRLALLHSSVPYGAILDRLGLGDPSSAGDGSAHAPLFQAVFDYKQGQAESGSIGAASILDSRTPRAGSPYDFTLEMSDDPTKDPLITVKLNSERYAPEDAEVVLDAYLSTLSIFSRNPALRVEDGRLDQGAKARA